MNEEILVSIICNTYNHEPYIAQTIEGFLSQIVDFQYEILIHDDASTDATADIIRKYENAYPAQIKPIYQTENQYSKKVPITSSYQYPRAKGKYLAYCEGDDFWISPNKLQKQVDFLEQNPKYVACVHQNLVVDKNSNPTGQKTFGNFETGGLYGLRDFETNELPGQLATLVCRNIMLNPESPYPNQFASIPLNGDIKLYLYLLAHGDIFRMDDALSAYRFVHEIGGESWSSRQRTQCNGYKDWNALKKMEQVYEELYDLKLNLRNRREEAAVRTVLDLQTRISANNIMNAIYVICVQRGTLSGVCSRVCNKLLYRITKKRK